eukprot:6490987-Amphidinium_carterae.1
MAPKGFLAPLSPGLFSGEKGEGKGKAAALELSLRSRSPTTPQRSVVATVGTHSRSPRVRADTPQRRSDVPASAPRVRGSLRTALQIAADPVRRQAADERYQDDIYANSARSASDALWTTWGNLHRSRYEQPVLPLTPESVAGITSLMKAAGYRTANHLYRAKKEHCKGYDWDDALATAFRDAKRSLTRGIGPPHQASPLSLEKLSSLDVTEEPLVEGGPLNPFALCVVGSFFLTRELELAAACVHHVEVRSEEYLLTWTLPASKTDVEGRSVKRSWGCTCGGSSNVAPCPFHVLVNHFKVLARHWDGIEALPLFPTKGGAICTKLAVADSIQAIAKLTGEELIDPEGRRRFTGHSLRVTGAQHLARVGVPLHLIQLQARWASEAILRYVRTAPLQNLTD